MKVNRTEEMGPLGLNDRGQGMSGLTQVAEASIKSWVTETGTIGAVAASIVGTFALPVASLPEEAFRTSYIHDK